MDISIDFTSISKAVATVINNYNYYIAPLLVFTINYITTTLSLAISEADKNNDGNLSNDELEELCLYLIRTAKTPWIKLLPEPIIRIVISYLCKKREKQFQFEVPNIPSVMGKLK